jgi:glycosyltransferase involved in cell wall biosynthesis
MAQPNRSLRIASFGFRSFPPRAGAAGADKFALEFLPRLASRGHEVVAYNRVYSRAEVKPDVFCCGVRVRTLLTFSKSGPEAVWHSLKVTWDIIRHNRADVVHIQNGGNTPFAIILRLFGKKTFLTEDGLDWKRPKWSWYAKIYFFVMIYLTAFSHNALVFDNTFVRDYYEKKFRRAYPFIPYGSDVNYDGSGEPILDELGLEKGEYFLFVGRFIPDKGLHYLISAFERLSTNKKLVLVGGSANQSGYEKDLRSTTDSRVSFPGYRYGSSVHALMKNCFCYIQPSDLEGLSPVILESCFLGAPVICSDIQANRFVLQANGIYFQQGNSDDLKSKLENAINDPGLLRNFGNAQREHVTETFSWERVTDQYIRLFSGELECRGTSAVGNLEVTK